MSLSFFIVIVFFKCIFEFFLKLLLGIIILIFIKLRILQKDETKINYKNIIYRST